MKPITTIFIGTSAEGIPTLEALVADKSIHVPAVITQPDRPTGRKQELQPTPIKTKAEELGLTVHTPDKDGLLYRTVLTTYSPELAVTIAYGNFLPQHFLDGLSRECLNIHYSLLPKLRGAVPVQAAILNGYSKTGVTIQIMEVSMDTGPIVAQKETEITSNDTTATLKKRLIPMGTELLMTKLPEWLSDDIIPKEQDHTKATYCYMKDISKENAKIDWNSMEPGHIERMVRALIPWPVAWTILPDGKRLKIFKSELTKKRLNKQPGTIVKDTDGLLFATKDPDTAFKAVVIQPEGKKKMTAEAFLSGWVNR